MSSNFLRNFLIAGAALVLLGGVLYGFYLYSLNTFLGEMISEAVEIDPGIKNNPVTLKLTFVGDIMCHEVQIREARNGPGTYDFQESFSLIDSKLSSSDMVCGNFETVCGGRDIPYQGFPGFNTPDAFPEAIAQAGFDVVSTANNHAFDFGKAGLLRTHAELTENNLTYVGSYATQEDADSIRIVTIQGVKVGFIAFTQDLNGHELPEDQPWLVNSMHPKFMSGALFRARSAVDILVVFLHFSQEGNPVPDAVQQRAVIQAQAAGADLIIGSGPHIVQAVEKFPPAPDARLDSGLVAWSLGNFISAQAPPGDAGLLLQVEITRIDESRKFHLQKVTQVPVWTYPGDISQMRRHIVMAESDSNATFLSDRHMLQMRTACKAVREAAGRKY